MDVHLLDEVFLASVMRFCGFTSRWLLSFLYDPSNAEWPPRVFPPSKPHSTTWGAVPEALLEEMGEALSLVAFLNDPPLDRIDAVVSLFVTLMSSPHLLRNPHLRPRLFSFVFPFTSAAVDNNRQAPRSCM